MTDEETNVPVGEPDKENPEALPLQALEERGKNDIARILQEVKLPERRDFAGAAGIPKAEPPSPEASILEEHIVKSASGAAKDKDEESSKPGAQQDGAFSSAVTPLRTLKDDIETVVREKKISLVRAATLEEEKKHGQERLVPEQVEIQARRSRRTVGILFASGLFIFLGLAALLGIFVVMKAQEPTPAPPPSSILFAEQTVTFALNQPPQTLKSELSIVSGHELGQLGSITRVVPVVSATSSGNASTSPATLAQFFSALGISPPQELMNSIGPDFFFGFHVVDTNAPLIIIPVTSYDHAFAGMLAWEPTMDQDLAPIFAAVSPTKLDQNGVPEARTFEDDTMRNYDVRELKDDSGNLVLYYSFPTPNILVIAQSAYSFTEILSRLQAGREL